MLFCPPTIMFSFTNKLTVCGQLSDDSIVCALPSRNQMLQLLGTIIFTSSMNVS